MSLLVVAFRVVDAQTLLRRWCWRIRSSRTPATASSRRRSADRPFPAMLSEKYVEQVGHRFVVAVVLATVDRKSTRLNSSHGYISYAVFCLKKKKKKKTKQNRTRHKCSRIYIINR